MSLSKASKKFKIPKGTLSNKLNNVKQEGKAGGQMYLSVSRSRGKTASYDRHFDKVESPT